MDKRDLSVQLDSVAGEPCLVFYKKVDHNSKHAVATLWLQSGMWRTSVASQTGMVGVFSYEQVKKITALALTTKALGGNVHQACTALIQSFDEEK